MKHHAGNTRTVSDRRRARTLAGSLAFVLAGAFLYSQNVQARVFSDSNNITPHPSDSIGSTTLATTASGRAPAQGEITATRRKAGAAVAMATAWTSPRAHAEAHSNNWDAARRECVDVPGAVATAAPSSSLSQETP